MPKFDTSTPTIERKFSDISFKVPAPFTANHPLTENEAKWMNSVLASVVGNAYSGDIRRALASANETAKKEFVAGGGKAKDFKPLTVADLAWDHAAKFAQKFAEYELGVSNRGEGGGKGPTDPVGRMVNFLASEELKARIQKKGLSVAAFYKAKSEDGTTSKWAELLAQLIERDGERLTAQAKAQIEALSANDADTDDLLDGVSLPEAEAPSA